MATAISEKDQKAYRELRFQVQEAQRNLVVTSNTLKAKENFKRKNELTFKEVSELPEDTRTYKAVGRAFLFSPMPEIKAALQDNIKKTEGEIGTLQGQQKYFEKQTEKLDKEFEELRRHLDL